MASRRVEFDVVSLKDLLVWYSQGEIPIDAEIKTVQASQFLPRWICLIIEADDWTDTPFDGLGYNAQQPFIFRYEGDRTLNLGHLQGDVQWSEPGEIEAPKRQ